MKRIPSKLKPLRVRLADLVKKIIGSNRPVTIRRNKKQIAQCLGLTPSHLSKIIRGTAFLNLERVIDLIECATIIPLAAEELQEACDIRDICGDYFSGYISRVDTKSLAKSWDSKDEVDIEISKTAIIERQFKSMSNQLFSLLQENQGQITEEKYMHICRSIRNIGVELVLILSELKNLGSAS